MSVSRSPRLNEIRLREEKADQLRVAAIVAAVAFLSAALLVLGVTIKVIQ